ncbi:MAG: peptidase M48, partial [Acinetobacter sp.]|nr:peptidase M48 [Acinetobacter sp.]
AIGAIIWLVGSLGVLITRFIKFITLGGRTYKNDQKTKRLIQNDANIQTLLRIYVHHSGSQIHSEYAEAISHMCFANALSPQSWMNIHPKIAQRIFELNPAMIQDLQLENLKKLKNQPLFNLFRSLEEISPDLAVPWSSPQPLPLLRLSPISFAIKDAIKPLKPEIRENWQRPELIDRALQTATGSREVMVAILMIRQYREFIPTEAEVSRAIVDSLLHLDGRVHIAIFQEACKNIGGMPATIARQFLMKLARIIQEDGEIGLLDALLLERVKFELHLMPIHAATALEDVKPSIVRLIDALLHVQQINSDSQLEVREMILTRILSQQELELYSEISDEPIDLAEILNDISGLLLRDRFSILAVAEICLWNDRVITQDELDVLELLYWRLGFEAAEMIDLMQKKNSLTII